MKMEERIKYMTSAPGMLELELQTKKLTCPM